MSLKMIFAWFSSQQGVAWEMCGSKYVTVWKMRGSKYVTAWKRCGSKYSCMRNVRFEALSHAMPFWLENHANIIFDTHFQTKNIFLTIVNGFLCTFKKDYEKKSFCGGVPLIPAGRSATFPFYWYETHIFSLSTFQKASYSPSLLASKLATLP